MHREAGPALAAGQVGVEGLPLEFSLTFSCLTKDRPCLGFLLAGIVGGRREHLCSEPPDASALVLSPSLPTVVSGGDLGRGCFGGWCRSLWGALCTLEGAFADVQNSLEDRLAAAVPFGLGHPVCGGWG